MRGWVLSCTAAMVCACTSPAEVCVKDCDLIPPPEPAQYSFLGASQIAADLVEIRIAVAPPVTREYINDYSSCVAADYALDLGGGYARHVRTNLLKEGGVWRADAIYTISVELPPGLKTIVAEDRVKECRDQAIPLPSDTDDTVVPVRSSADESQFAGAIQAGQEVTDG
ncbi:hypothetical protein [Litoreibacter roseus]|uniref:Lipoprotein n=1 Tax=Litoreibacter roseus TaxID=2601869 RepID=A0A6N6JI96_9RHOB|nr:hypothetical protein [Litoreibacter roseus]GFE65805.1 hypothetical protein KIN_28790 [Litoreibacter roseus]